MRDDGDVERVIGDALAAAAAGEAVLVDVRIDYSKRTRFTDGVIRTNLKRFGIADQARLVGRALWRKLTG
jgi:acetolactate synthase-1/2/3 large subunit